jgi:formate dehydrogenase subunit beta
MIEEFIRDHPRSHLAVILRPCELRALVELHKRNRVHYRPISTNNEHESLVMIGVDCPGTFPLAEYNQRLAAHQDDAKMIRVELAYGLQSSYIPRQVRTACQMCDSPSPFGADITIGTVGVAPQGDLLVIARDENVDDHLKLREVTDEIAAEKQLNCRAVMVKRLIQKSTEKRSDLIEAYARRSIDVNTALAMFARCTLCADCLDACPLYDGELSGMLGVGETHQNAHPMLSELVSVSRWMASCSGCGMCQEACEHGVSLTSLVTLLSHRIQSELHYEPGDPAQHLPWTV